ncbi:polyketide biosynthesis methyltransferase [Rothia sp. AR01]|uniref:Polyketide biosynthesis methyltransferase n=1 Tax=Rothia santali TaxID=2949643 RepID=A0A9X2KMK0_9MICC|nr:methyltransferase [Rothia santali]MCP3427286.1 polyketide biosynthesis methyltransferase [Rothia santali]
MNSPSPQRIVDLAVGFMGTQQLAAASRIGLFAALAEGPLPLPELARATGRAERQVGILAAAMHGLGLLERGAGGYALAPDAAAYLSGAGGLNLSPFIRFLGGISYRQWLGYGETVDADRPGTLDLDEAGWAEFLDGVMTYNALHAEQFAAALDFSPYRSALDFGGLAAGFSLAAMAQNPELSTRFVYAPDFADSVRAAVAEAGVEDRASVEEGATETTEPGGEHDLVLLTHVLHRFDAEANRAILRAARAAAAPGAALMLIDFFLDAEGPQRPLDALHAGEYFNIDGTVVYPEGEVRGWLEETGWRPGRLVELPGSPRVLLAEAA